MKRKANNYTGEIKPGDFNLTDISAYFLHTKKKGGDNLLSGQTYSDLGVEELFTFADRTTSGIGQRYLSYAKNHPPGKRGDREERRCYQSSENRRKLPGQAGEGFVPPAGYGGL